MARRFLLPFLTSFNLLAMPGTNHPFTSEHHEMGFQLFLKSLILFCIADEDLNRPCSLFLVFVLNLPGSNLSLRGRSDGSRAGRESVLSGRNNAGRDKSVGESSCGLAGILCPLIIALQPDDVADP